MKRFVLDFITKRIIPNENDSLTWTIGARVLKDPRHVDYIVKNNVRNYFWYHC